MTPGSPEITDAELIGRVRTGDVNAFEPLISRHRNQVLGIVARHVPPAEVAATAEDVFVRAFLSLKSYRAERPFNHWLARIAVRACCDFWRQRKRVPELAAAALSGDQQEWLEQATQAAAQEVFARDGERRRAAEVLDWALARLSATERTTVTMLHRDGYSVRDIAQLLGWTTARVKVTAFRARHKLRGLLGAELRKER